MTDRQCNIILTPYVRTTKSKFSIYNRTYVVETIQYGMIKITYMWIKSQSENTVTTQLSTAKRSNIKPVGFWYKKIIYCRIDPFVALIYK